MTGIGKGRGFKPHDQPSPGEEGPLGLRSLLPGRAHHPDLFVAVGLPATFPGVQSVWRDQ